MNKNNAEIHYYEKTEKEESVFHSNTPQHISKFTLPTTIDIIIEKLGQPDSTKSDTSFWCPIGQMHFWNIDNDFQFISIGDCYKYEPDYSADCRVIVCKRLNDMKSDFYYNNIHLNYSTQQTATELEKLVNQNPEYILDTLNGQTTFDFHISQNFSFSYYISTGNSFIYFAFDKNGNLNYIIESSFNLIFTC